jgi:Cu2+-exporting ATPase
MAEPTCASISLPITSPMARIPGTLVAIESAGLILVKSNPLDVVKIIALSRASYRKMIQNLWWVADYNIIALPLAAGALLMSLSTIIVAINAQLLNRQENLSIA